MPQRDETFEICVVLTTWLNYDCLCHIPLSLRVLFISLNIREDKMMTLKNQPNGNFQWDYNITMEIILLIHKVASL